MNTDIIKGKWKEVKGQLRGQWGKLTDDEIEQMKGNQEELQGILQKKYGYAKDKASNEIDAFLKEKGWSDKQ